jgi:hypothetical protein
MKKLPHETQRAKAYVDRVTETHAKFGYTIEISEDERLKTLAAAERITQRRRSQRRATLAA